MWLGMALLPWNITLQILLMPLYLWFLVGKVLPLDRGVLAVEFPRNWGSTPIGVSLQL
jgi:hypothetical protein